MAVSQIEEKILGRLAEEIAPANALLSASLYQVLGLSILLSRKLYRARKLRKLDITRDTKSLQLYHHIIWLAREGLSITEVYILPYCQNGEQGPECRVMAAKLRASLYHVFCLFHNHPPISQITVCSPESGSPSSSTKMGKAMNGSASEKSPKRNNEAGDSRRRTGKLSLRDAIPSMVSEGSYVTNPYASEQTPPPGLHFPSEARRTPTRPPGLPPVNVAASQAAATFLLPPLNFLPMVREHFTTAQDLASSLLSPTHALRLSVALEHAAFLWDCAKEHERARRLARRTIKEVYSSSDGLDDDEFADASALVQALGGILKRGSNESTPIRPDSAPAPEPVAAKSVHRVPRKPVPPPAHSKPKQLTIDRTISVSPEANRRKGTRTATQSLQQITVRASMRSPERLSTVPEVGESTDEGAPSVIHATFSPGTSRQGTISPPTSRQPTASPPTSRLSRRTSHREYRSERGSSTASASDKASKRRIVEQAEQDLVRRQSQSNRSNGSGSRSVESRVRQQRTDERRGELSSSRSAEHTVQRRRSGSNKSNVSGSQPHSRQATPPEGMNNRLSSKRSSGSTKRARRKEARRKAAVTPDETFAVQHGASSAKHRPLPPTPLREASCTSPQSQSPLRWPLPAVPIERSSESARKYQMFPEKQREPVGARNTRSPPKMSHLSGSSSRRESVQGGYTRAPSEQPIQYFSPARRHSQNDASKNVTTSQSPTPAIDERRDAILRTLEIISAVSRGFIITRHGSSRAGKLRLV